MLNDSICVLPKAGEPVKAALIMLHGYGANGDDLISMAPVLQRENPHLAFYAPNAPTQMGHDSYRWYSVDELADETAFEQFGYVEKLMCRAKDQISLVNSFIDLIKEKHGLQDNDIALMGFSQGGLLALMTGLTRVSFLNCLIGCSAVPLELNNALTLPEVLSRPNTLLTHGEDDDRVPLVGMEMTENTLKNLDVAVTTHIVPGMGHDIDMSSVLAISEFLRVHTSTK